VRNIPTPSDYVAANRNDRQRRAPTCIYAHRHFFERPC
jgi:hypothetical protein